MKKNILIGSLCFVLVSCVTVPNKNIAITLEESKKMEDWELISCIKGKDFYSDGKRVICKYSTPNDESKIILDDMRSKLKAELFSRHPEWDEQTKEEMLTGVIKIGMTKELVVLRWGKPSDINRTVTSNRVREQWVYGYGSSRKYLYFENGILTTWQD